MDTKTETERLMSYYNNGCGAARKKRPQKLLKDPNAKCICGDYRYRHETSGIGACKDCDDCVQFTFDSSVHGQCGCGHTKLRHDTNAQGEHVGECRHKAAGQRDCPCTKFRPVVHVDKPNEQLAFENDLERRRVGALASFAESAKRFVDLLVRVENLVVEVRAEEKRRLRERR